MALAFLLTILRLTNPAKALFINWPPELQLSFDPNCLYAILCGVTKR